MPIRSEVEAGNVVRIIVSGQLGYEEFVRNQTDFVAGMQEKGALRLLVVLDRFAGWAPDSRWQEVDFLMEGDSDFQRIAIVGDPSWRDEVLAFTGAGLRTAPVEFFEATRMEEALAWLRS